MGVFERKYLCPVGTLTSSWLIAILLTYMSGIAFSASSTRDTTPRNESNIDFQTLICLKLHLSNSSSADLLGSWNKDSLNFCSWSGVTCSNTQSRRVVALDLESFDFNGQIPPCISSLTSLTRIHLPNNQLSGQIPSELGQLNRLEYINLSSNSFSGVIPNTLASSRLQIIDLRRNSLHGEIPPNLTKCSNLQILSLDSNKLTGGIPEGFGTLHNLSVLRLGSNSLTGNIPLSLGSRSSLVSVVLKKNRLTGPIPPILANSSSLQVLDLIDNQLGGEIPPDLFNSTSLQKLALGTNKFAGSIPVVSQIDSPLQYLILSSNNLAGPIPSTLGNFSSLLWLLLAGNNLQGSIPMSIGKIPYLEVLDLSYNNLLGIVPPTLYNISSLTYLGIAINNVSGSIPLNIGKTLPNIQNLILQRNQFQGKIPPSLVNITSLEVINLRTNAFYGAIPSFGILPNLTEINLGRNQLEAGDWSFQSSLKNCTQLVKLSLESNIIQGILPSSVGDLPSSLKFLLLNANKISGNIPPEIGNITSLMRLGMEQNYFTGNIPDSFGYLSNLTVLNLSHNKLSGQIPSSIGKLRQLIELDLQENNLSGSIPSALGSCKNLLTMNLSCNTLDGSIPKELFSLYSLSEGLDLSHNNLSGHIPLEIGGLINVGLLNMSNNQMSGIIPNTLGSCIHLESLRLEGNFLEGRIPESLTNLKGIGEIDLSRNNLSGEIPEFFQSFSSLNVLNLSFNNLEGQIPEGGIFQNTSKVFIQGNNLLRDSSAMFQLPLCDTATSKQWHNYHTLKIVGLSVALALVALSCFTVILLKRRKKSKPQHPPSCKELKKFSYADLVKATNGFSSDNLVGSGKYGSVYRGLFESQPHVAAIKVFKLDQLGAPKSFLVECEALRNSRHRNLVRVITACSTLDPTGQEFKALILEYMSNGNLESWLYPTLNGCDTRRSLSLGSRITIAVDIASALDYLHNHCMPPMVHCDLKPGNVLLDDVMGAHIGDFGLTKFLHKDISSMINSSTSLGARGSIGYIAPEYGFGSKISMEGDVYSYGIIILEMLTGKRPTDAIFNDGLNLHRLVEKAFPEKITEILDPSIIPYCEDEYANNNFDHENRVMVAMLSCTMQLVKLGLSCSAETPRDRPMMKDVYAEVTAIKDEFSILLG